MLKSNKKKCKMFYYTRYYVQNKICKYTIYYKVICAIISDYIFVFIIIREKYKERKINSLIFYILTIVLFLADKIYIIYTYIFFIKIYINIYIL